MTTFSVPIYQLKRLAKAMSRDEGIALNQALDRVAQHEGFARWSLLAARAAMATPADSMLKELRAGELVLVGARPGQGKTRLCLELAIAAMRRGASSYFFSLDYTEADMLAAFATAGEDPLAFNDRFVFDDSDEICAPYITARLTQARSDSLVVIDYLQILDQRRDNPALEEQVLSLKTFAAERGLIMLVISQIDRRFESNGEGLPQITDVRLPNPLNLRHFSRTCFINAGVVVLSEVA